MTPPAARPPHTHGWKSFDRLNNRELYELLRLRSEVFVIEQACVYQDIDGRDPDAEHLLAWDPEGNLAGCLRIFAPGVTAEAARIGRVATARTQRGTGLGWWLMGEAIAAVTRRYGNVPVTVAAQAHLEGFYGRLGFKRSSENYLEDGILHCDMLREATR